MVSESQGTPYCLCDDDIDIMCSSKVQGILTDWQFVYQPSYLEFPIIQWIFPIFQEIKYPFLSVFSNF